MEKEAEMKLARLFVLALVLLGDKPS